MLVEFALVFPILMVMMMGIVDFGVNLSNQISVRQGVREAARQGAVANFGSTTNCGATGVQTGSDNMRRLICLTKSRSSVTGADVRVAVRFDPSPSSYPAPSTSGPVGNGIVVCSAVPLTSVSGLFGFAVSDKYLRTKTVMRIEQASGVAETPAAETDPTGESWAWCTA